MKNLTAKLTAIIDDKLLSKTTNLNNKNEDTEERRAPGVTREAEKWVRVRFLQSQAEGVLSRATTQKGPLPAMRARLP